MFYAITLSLFVALLDGLGLAMFLPLLQMAGGQDNANEEGMGYLSFLAEGMQDIGLELTVGNVLLAILFFFVLKGVAKFIESYYTGVVVRMYFVRKLRLDMVSKLSNYAYKSFVNSDSGRIQNTLSGEIANVVSGYQQYILTIQAGVMILVYIFLAFLSNPQFAFFVVLGGIFSNLLYNTIYNKTKEASKNVTKVAHTYQSLLIQKVAFFKYLRATGLMARFTEKLKNSILEAERFNKKIYLYTAIMSSTREPLIILVVVSVILIQITLFTATIGPIILSLLFFYRSLTFVMGLQTSWNAFLSVSGSFENMKLFTKELMEAQEQTGKEKVGKLTSGFVIRSAAFSYGDLPVLRDISLDIKRNETVAFVGESGSGKTTLVNILSGLLPLGSGEFLIDDKDIRFIDLDSYRSRIGYVTQEPVIFSDTIFNNVTFWAEKTDENLLRFWEALRKASMLRFVRELPLKEDAPLGSNGVMISGGQKQRISIARELYKDIDILIMDEATSALDSETERVIQESLDDLKGKYTILLVAHRLSTVKNADKIVLLQDGIIVCEGSFDELISQSKFFEQMVILQKI